MSDKTLRKKLEAIKRQKIVSSKVVSLQDFRSLKSNVEVHTILVVDDDDVMRNGLKRILDGEGYNVVLAADGLELSRILETTRLDLIVLDVRLPWVDGVELCQLIKTHYSLKSVPIIIMSDRRSREMVDRAIDAGADDFIAKPFEIDTILSIVNRLLLIPKTQN
ncbi:MAG: response regulator [Deltaproteobacteria bacterium]|nr:response regulator [Deltaproteobacteria bacterium]